MDDPDDNPRLELRPESENPRSSLPGEEDHLARAKERMDQLRGKINQDDLLEYQDKFYAEAPAGWSYNWKTWSIYNQHNPKHIANMMRGGWSFVPASRHRELLYPEYKDETIIIDGQILMERPIELTKRAEELQYRAATEQVRAKEEQLGAAPEGTAPRNHPQVRPQIRKSVGPVEIPS